MKRESNWQNKTLENLEKNVWPPLDSDDSSYLIQTTYSLRKKQLKDFSVEDLRIMIGQDIGLEYLVPMAIDVLDDNILAEGDLYEGDLLKSVLTSDPEYWKTYTDNWNRIKEIFDANEQTLKDSDTINEIKNGWFDSYKIFQSYGR